MSLPLVIAIVVVLAAPVPRFNNPFSTVVEAADGTLLGARIADDGQWRFPPPDSIPHRFELALLTYEDRHFYRHPGVNPVSLLRAARLNLKERRVVSGGSTITMQVARMAAGNRKRTLMQKGVEMLSALKLELLHSKSNILMDWCANAPFGGNVVGLEAAVWKYSGYAPYNMSWADAATYAILPNSPALLHPGRNREILLEKRNALLREMHAREFFDDMTLLLALDEPLLPPGGPLPQHALHLTDYYHTRRRGERIRTTIDSRLQVAVSEMTNSHSAMLAGNHIHNAACLVVSVEGGEVLAYVGNSTTPFNDERGRFVDIIRSQRSPGSILKPLLYAGMLSSGEILPGTLMPDVPVRYPGFAPENFDGSFSGAVTAAEALSRSLNVPAVRMLQSYTPARFQMLMRKSGIEGFDKPAGHYGLSMILGGGETSLMEITGMYASMSRVLKKRGEGKGYSSSDYRRPVTEVAPEPPERVAEMTPPLSAGSIWLTYRALREVVRPESEAGWQFMVRSPGVAWKTGTSYGYRDGWAVGTTTDYVVGVWAGNASGEGRPGLTGVASAAPLLFDVIGYMGSGVWFERPGQGELTLAEVCLHSGHRAGIWCEEVVNEWIPVAGLRSEACPYHTMVHLNRERTHRVMSECAGEEGIVTVKWFVLPPAMEHFYRRINAHYRVLPPMSPLCAGSETHNPIEFIYPPAEAGILIPRDHTGRLSNMVAEIIHRSPEEKVFWHLNDEYLGETTYIHQMPVQAPPGNNNLIVTDSEGNSRRVTFRVK